MATLRAHAGAGRRKPPFPPFQTETFASQLFWLAITFVAALSADVAGRAAARRRHHRGARRARSQATSREAQRLKDEADAAIAAYEKALADARARAQAIGRRDPRQAAWRRPTSAARRSRQQLNAKLAEAEKTIAATKTAAMAQCARHRDRRGRGDRRAADRHRRRPARPSPTRSTTRSSAEDDSHVR